MSSTVQRNTWDNAVIVTRDGATDSTWDGRVKNLVYDPDTMEWVADTGSAGVSATTSSVKIGDGAGNFAALTSQALHVYITGGSDLGSDILTGSGAPDSSLGNNGDFYLDTATNDYYTKANGAWTQQGTLGDVSSPGGAATNVQYNDGSAFAGSSNLAWDNANATLSVGGARNANAGTQKIQAIGSLAVASISEGGVLGTTPAGNHLWNIGGDTGGTAGLNLHGGNAITGATTQVLLKSGTSVFGLNLGINATTIQSGYNVIVHDRIASTGATRMAIQAGAGQSTTDLLQFQAQAATVGGGTVLASISSAGKFGFAGGDATAPGVFPQGDSNTGFFSASADTIGATIGGTQKWYVDSNGVQIGAGTRSTHPLEVRVASSGWFGDGFKLQSPTAGRYWEHTIDSAGVYYFGRHDAGGGYVCYAGNGVDGYGGVRVGSNNSPTHKLEIYASAAADTTPSNLSNLGAVFAVINGAATANNYGGIHFRGTGGINAAIIVQNEVHTTATRTGNMRFFTTNSGTSSEKFRITAPGNLMFSASQYSTGAGTPQLGTNCPASTLTAPNTWLKFEKSDGTVVYVPAWA